MKLPLKVIESPYREITRPVVHYVENLRRGSPRDVVCIYLPEYVVGRWWENVLHNQSSLRLKGRLLFEPGVMVTSVPWQLHSTTRRDLHRVRRCPATSAAASRPSDAPADPAAVGYPLTGLVRGQQFALR